MSVLERCQSYRESNKGSKERQGPTLSVCFTEVSVKRESTAYHIGSVVKYVSQSYAAYFVRSCGMMFSL